MREFDVTIIGAGLAGLYFAKNVSEQGSSVLLVDRKTDLSKGIHTTGIFVRKTFEDFDFPAKTLGRPISNVSIYSPKLQKIDLVSPREEFRVGRMGELYNSLLDECLKTGVEFLSGTRYVAAVASGEDSLVTLERKGETLQVRARVLVGADGARSRVASDMGLDENKEWIVGYEEVFKDIALNGEPALHCFLSEPLAPGYLAWISNDGEETHIGVGGYPSRFDPREALKVFKQEIVPQIIDTKAMTLSETRGGRIPVGGVLRRIGNSHALLIGDAAGAVSPLTAGGLDPCLRLSKFAAAVVSKRFETGDPRVLAAYSGSMFRKKFRNRLLMRLLLKNARSNVLLQMGFAALRTSSGKKLAEKVFFKRASFPDVDSAAAASQFVSVRRKSI
ncbi:MAG: NAD(P)/FAD-dependent oxidoreductase [Pyrinomonadaceae bacterium]|nr:NAD(P)/FAD-dependent oxidoreductase [Pyrinomonadaceae bacterium]